MCLLPGMLGPPPYGHCNFIKTKGDNPDRKWDGGSACGRMTFIDEGTSHSSVSLAQEKDPPCPRPGWLHWQLL